MHTLSGEVSANRIYVAGSGTGNHAECHEPHLRRRSTQQVRAVACNRVEMHEDRAINKDTVAYLALLPGLRVATAGGESVEHHDFFF